LDELKTHLRDAHIVLRSKTADLVKQEFYGFLMAHFAIRGLMHEAALKADEDPDRLSFLHAARVIRRKLPAFGAIPPFGRKPSFIKLYLTISSENGGVEPPSLEPRGVKRKMSNYRLRLGKGKPHLEPLQNCIRILK
jgi:hypothetical protein